MQQRYASAHLLDRLPYFVGACVARSACLVMVACTADDLSIGAGRPAGDASGLKNPNCDQGIFQGNMHARSQADILIVAGCEEINGDLSIESFQDMDLRPLGSLRTVQGTLLLNADHVELGSGEIVDLPPVSHLEGFGALERVGDLTLLALSVSDLSAFSNLSKVGPYPSHSLTLGWIEIRGADVLIDLSGLAQLAEWDVLQLEESPELSSLNGLRPNEDHHAITLYNLPKLRDVSALASLYSLDTLYMQSTGIENLDDLRRLRYANNVQIYENPSLLQIDGLQDVTGTAIVIVNNPLLDHLPKLHLGSKGGVGVPAARLVVSQATPSVVVTGNDSLRSVSQLDISLPLDRYEIADNPQLVDVTPTTFFRDVYVSELTEDDLARASGRYLSIHDNSSLRYIELGFSNLGLLSIQNNPVLSQLDITFLETVDELHVANNPKLSTADFARVKTFESEISGNLDEPAP